MHLCRQTYGGVYFVFLIRTILYFEYHANFLIFEFGGVLNLTDGRTDGRANGRSVARTVGRTVEHATCWRAVRFPAELQRLRIMDGRCHRPCICIPNRTHLLCLRCAVILMMHVMVRTDGRTDGRITDGRTDGRSYRRMLYSQSYNKDGDFPLYHFPTLKRWPDAKTFNLATQTK